MDPIKILNVNTLTGMSYLRICTESFLYLYVNNQVKLSKTILIL